MTLKLSMWELFTDELFLLVFSYLLQYMMLATTSDNMAFWIPEGEE